nr:hypothetical protein [Streptomyces sp. AC550_RSS872]
MRVQREGVRPFQADIDGAGSFIEDPEHAVGAVDVEPQIVFTGDLRDFLQRVDGAGVDRSGAGRDEHRTHARLPVRSDQATQCAGVHAACAVDRDRAEVMAAQAKEFRCLAQTAVPLG